MVRVVGLSLIQDEHGVWCVRRIVPKRLEQAVARVQGASRARQPWLKRSLRTKDEKRAKVLAKPVMMEFDRVLAQAKALLVEQPVRSCLTELALAVMRAEVRALQAIQARHQGEPIESPKLVEPRDDRNVSSSGSGLRAAYEGWLKVTPRRKSTSMEFERGIERFIELHGDPDVAKINRGQFREAAQLVPAKMSGKLLKVPLPELVAYSRSRLPVGLLLRDF